VWAAGKGLLARAVFVIGKDDRLRHVEYVKEVTTEPSYAAALEAARSLD
jgi:thiol peroxidase